MSDSHNDVNNSTDNTTSIQDKLVRDSLTANQRLNEQVQQGLQQNSQAANSSDTPTMSQSASQQFSSSQSLPESVPQGQQLTQPAIVTPKDNVANKSASGFDKTAIVNPHTAETDGEEDTHFGYRTVKKAEKQEKVAEVFTSVAKKYDIMNDLMSFGIHRLWKRYAISLTGVRAGQQVLDIAGGTGDLAKAFSKEVGRTGHVVLSDINEAMLEVGRERLLNAGCSNVDFVLANAENLAPFADESFDLVTISFGLRNVTDKDAALRSMYRVLKKGGRLVILEFSKPIFEPLSKAYDLYSFTALPLMGKLVANDSESYQYLAESIRMHPDQRTLKQMMENAGFVNTDYHNLTGGIVAIHRGFKK